MASIDITTQSGAVGNGDLQLQNGAPMDATLRFVTDALNTASPLKLSTSLVQTTSTLKITTNDNPYIDAEDGSGNNRFTVGRATSSQQVNIDFASNPAGSTTAVGAIRTFRDGTNLSEAMTFIEDGSVGIGTTAPVGLLDLFKSAAATRLAIRGDAGQNRLISYRTGALQRFGLYVNNTAESGSNAGSNFAIRAYDDAGTLLSTPLFIERSTGNVGIGTTAPAQLLTLQNGNVDNISGSRLRMNMGPNPYWELQANNGGVSADRKFTINTSSAAGDVLTLTQAGNVGIGTTSPTTTLHLDASGGATIRLQRTSASANRFDVGTDGTNMEFNVRDTGNFTFGGTGSYVRLLSGTGGIQFNGDTAAANALDDYEEGTWTMGISFGGASVAVTTSSNTGTYTKIGRQVTVNGYLALSNKGSSTGSARITGLPFTVTNANANYSAVSLQLSSISFANQYSGISQIGTTNVELYECTEAGVITNLTDADFANNSDVVISLTYFV